MKTINRIFLKLSPRCRTHKGGRKSLPKCAPVWITRNISARSSVSQLKRDVNNFERKVKSEDDKVFKKNWQNLNESYSKRDITKNLKYFIAAIE